MIFFRQFSYARQFQPVDGGSDPLQNVAGNQNLMGGENQAQLLLLLLACQFREHKFIQRQYEKVVCRRFNAQAARLRISGVTFGRFVVHVFVRVWNDAGIALTGKAYQRRSGQIAKDDHAAGPKAGCD
jgi:hypothetical protein